MRTVSAMEASSSHSTEHNTNTDPAISQLAARLVSDYLHAEGCQKSQQHFHLESPIKSIFTHSCVQCTSPSSLPQLLKDYYRLQAIVNDKSTLGANQVPSIPQCKTSLQIVRTSTSRRKKCTRVNQLACIPLNYTKNGASNYTNNGVSSDKEFDNGDGVEGKLESLTTLVERHENTIKNIVKWANMQQKTLETLVINSLGGEKEQSPVEVSPSRKRKKEMPQSHSNKKRNISSDVGESELVDTDRGEYMTQLIDTILNDQSLLDKLVNYINQSLDQPTDSDVDDQNLIENMKTSDIAENVMRLTESDPQFESLLWTNGSEK